MKPAEFKAVFLSGERVYIRAYVEQDKEVTAAWAGTPFPVGAPRGEKLLKDWHTEWWPRARRYALCETATDEVVGGVTVGIRHLVGEFVVKIAAWRDDADELQAEAFKLIVPWLSEEWGLVSVTAHLADDEPASEAAAVDLGMSHQATFREALVRPGGARVDHLMFQKLGRVEAGVDA
jgi:RimJ/RimL family protein N-acetyltransferase